MSAAPLKEILALNRFDASRTEGFPEELAERVRRRFQGLDASDLPIPARQPARTPPDWDAQ